MTTPTGVMKVTCSRIASIFCAALIATAVLAQDEPTQAKAGQEIPLELSAIRASTGYSDPLIYHIYAPTGKSVARGLVEPGDSETVQLVPKVDGLYVFDGNPGKNAFSVDVKGAAWAVNISENRQLNVIDEARPLFFYVPADLGELELVFQGEAASMKLLRPDGSAAAEAALPQYETVTITAPVEGQSGWWRLELDLSEDQGIVFPEGVPPYIADAPLSEELMASLQGGLTMPDFDLRPTPRAQLTDLEGGKVKYPLTTSNDLKLGFTANGRLVSVKIADRELAAGDAPPLLGFFVRDEGADSDLIALRGKSRRTAEGVIVDYRADEVKLGLRARYAALRDHIAVDVSVRNLADTDRAVTVYFALPFPSGEPIWWDDIINKREITSNATFGAFARAPAGANGHHSVYPFGCVSGEEALALAIPMDYPIYHRIAASGASGQLYLAVDLGLTEATTKFPNRADYSFVIYNCDPGWGLRAAAERYYQIFPDLFEKRMTEDGGWAVWGNYASMTNLDELGFKYHWGPAGPEAVAFDNANGLYAFLYNDSMRYFADLGQFDHRPIGAEAVAGMRKLLDAEDPRAQVLSVREAATGRKRYESREASMGRAVAEQWLRDSIAAVKASAAIDSKGQIQVGYLVNRKDWGGEDWWTGRCHINVNPDIPGGYGQFLYDRILDVTVADYRAQGAELDGFGLDNYFTSSTVLDFAREHLAACNYPPTFASGDFRPVVIGDTMMYEWVTELKRRLVAEGKWLMANTGHQPFPFAQHLLDINGLEWGLEGNGVATRMLAYHKQVVTLPVKPEHYEEPFIKAHLPMAAVPGGGGSSRFEPGRPAALLYAKYIPIILRMNAAGWEPVPWATADSDDISIERFGTELPLLFSLHNYAEEAVTTTVTVELDALDANTAASVRDVVSGEDLQTNVADGKLSFTVELAGSDATVVEVH